MRHGSARHLVADLGLRRRTPAAVDGQARARCRRDDAPGATTGRSGDTQEVDRWASVADAGAHGLRGRAVTIELSRTISPRSSARASARRGADARRSRRTPSRATEPRRPRACARSASRGSRRDRRLRRRLGVHATAGATASVRASCASASSASRRPGRHGRRARQGVRWPLASLADGVDCAADAQVVGADVPRPNGIRVGAASQSASAQRRPRTRRTAAARLATAEDDRSPSAASAPAARTAHGRAQTREQP